ncbi:MULTISPECIES: hypothetical protein [Streptomyces]|uniref:Uncharacterized protein n=2 Tax=Streptomyces TaxID=1883 RepID=A0A2U9P095_STRAS|nr:hypothetical protein [Streptomyces actuosus]AWT42575.1 hypothetical protein DMT42_09780 [Streptomyces actuosus]MBM4819782.1 hypothetical protein [Streptomyces actuosus]
MSDPCETAINLLVECSKLDRAGRDSSSFYTQRVQPALQAAAATGRNVDLFAEADRRYGKWLIDNAGR